MLGVGRRRGRRASVVARRYRSLEAGDDLGDVVAVELLDRGVEVRALLALYQQLRYLRAAL